MKRKSGGGEAHGSNRIRVLYLQPCEAFGGAERQASTAIPRLAQWGIDVVPLVGPNPTLCRWLDAQQVRGTILSPDFPGAWPKVRGLRRLALPWRYRRCLRRVAEQVEALVIDGGIDLVFAAMPFSWLAATEAARRVDVPIVWRAGGTMIGPAERALLWSWARLHPPDLLVCCGEAVRDTFGSLIPGPNEVVRNGVDLKLFRRTGARPHRPVGARLVVGFAARLVPQKRPDDFVAMAARVARRHPEVTFLVAGDGSRRARYQQMAHDFNLDGAIRFLGYVEDMRAFYASCDVVVLPSQSEGCPNVVLEAMAMQRPLVVSNTPATNEVVTNGREALIYPVGDIEAFTEAVTSLVESPGLRATVALAARERAIRDFDADASVTRLAQVLRQAATMREHRRLFSRRLVLGASSR